MNVLLVGLGEHKDFGFRSLRDAGHLVGVIDDLQKIPVDWCDWYSAADPLNEQAVLKAAQSARIRWDALLSWEELAIDVAHEVAEALKVPSPMMSSKSFRDKWVMHSRLRAAGMPSPNVGATTTLSACRELVAEAGFPAVIKPADYGGSTGVQILDCVQDLDAAFGNAVRVSLSGRVAVDRFVDGPEFSIETVSWGHGQHDLVGITQKVCGKPPYCVEMGHLVPATNIAAPQAEAIRSTACRALEALGMVRGVGHVEIRLSNDGPVVIEAAGRPAGDLIPKLVALATGRNIYILELLSAIGEDATAAAGEPAAELAAIRFFGGRPGEVVRQPPVRDLLPRIGPPGVVRELGYWYRDGVQCPRLESNADRLGYCILAGSRNEVLEAFDAAALLEPVTRGCGSRPIKAERTGFTP